MFPNRAHIDLAIIVALGIEAGGLVDRLKRVRQTRAAGFTVWQGEMRDWSTLVVASGVGRAKATRATQAIIDAHRPGAIISAGFAGGLDPAINRYEIIVPSSFVYDGAEAIDPSTRTTNVVTSKHHVGRLLTVDRIVRLPAEKIALGNKFQALAVDMESHAAATVCQRSNIPFMGVRVVSDPADEELPADMHNLIAQQTFAGQAGAVLGSIFRRPAAVKDMFRLHQMALEASDRLAEFLTKLT